MEGETTKKEYIMGRKGSFSMLTVTYTFKPSNPKSV
jgi:hypothetical protein